MIFMAKAKVGTQDMDIGYSLLDIGYSIIVSLRALRLCVKLKILVAACPPYVEC